MEILGQLLFKVLVLAVIYFGYNLDSSDVSGMRRFWVSMVVLTLMDIYKVIGM